MLRLIRNVIGIILLAFGIKFLKNKADSKRIFKMLPFIIVSLISFIMPFENLILRFNSPEQAFYYNSYRSKILKVVEKENSALVIYDDNGSTSASLYTKSNGKWKDSIFPNDQTLSRLETNEIYLITRERNSNNFYIEITVNSEGKRITDNYNSSFELYNSEYTWNSYVAYVENYNGNYIIYLDGKPYEIEI